MPALNALKAVFPESYVYLCRKHIHSDIEAWLIDKCNSISQCASRLQALRSSMEALTRLIRMFDSRISVEEYHNEIASFMNDLSAGTLRIPENEKFRKYLLKTWLPYQEHFVFAYLMRRKTYGKSTTNVVEGSHSSFKNFVKGVPDFYNFLENYKAYVKKMYKQHITSKLYLSTSSFKSVNRLHPNLYRTKQRCFYVK